MKRNCPRFIAVLVVLGLCRPTRDAPGGEPATEPTKTRIELLAAIAADGAEYEHIRDGLLGRGETIRPFLADTAEKGGTWQERTLSAILSERLGHREHIQAICDTQPNLRPIRAVDVRWEEYGKALAERAKRTPMFLVETVWKQNKLRWGEPSETRVYAMLALGIMEEKRAVHALIHVLDTEHDLTTIAPPTLLAACIALRDLGHPAAVPALLRTYILYPGPPRFVCRHALGRCVDEQSTELLQAAASRVGNKEAADFLMDLAKRKQLDIKEPARKP